MPPAAVRRPITVTVWLVMSIVCLTLSPVLLALAALASAVTGRPRALIFARLVVAYFALELAAPIPYEDEPAPRAGVPNASNRSRPRASDP
jgi:hypothetical protein